jgi:hypothetical protein
MRKCLATAVIAGFALVMAATPAFAHECYNASRSEKGNASIAEHSNSFIDFDSVLLGFATDPEGLGLCAPGAAYLLDAFHASDFDTSIVISIRALQAGGLLQEGKNAQAASNSSNGKGIDHLENNEQVNEIIGANIGAAAALCEV